ncbi:MAG TPA: hypothetical protein VFF13_02275, partial [archaeon]|nr:hypothetical protein [archaeon]
MDPNAISSLSDIEKKTLKALTREPQTPEEITKKSELNIDSVRRAVNWLAQKKLAQTNSIGTKKLTLTKEGEKALEIGLPEIRML